MRIGRSSPAERPSPAILESVVIRFAGDSGDGMQLTGNLFALATSWQRHNLRTLPDYPSEIRAPTGSLYGVSSYQIQFGSNRLQSAGDHPQVLIAMNPAALKVNIRDMAAGARVIVDSGAFSEKNIKKAGYQENPIASGALDNFDSLFINISELTLAAVKPYELTNTSALRCKNMWALGLLCWMYQQPTGPVIQSLENKLGVGSVLADANIAALKAGHAYGETAELGVHFAVQPIAQASYEPGTYRSVNGPVTLAYGLLVGLKLAGLHGVIAGYPITPATQLFQNLIDKEPFGLTAIQAEDEIAAACMAIGASYAGKLGITSTSGPGVALKTEAIGLAISAELPLVIVNWQRGGPSTGLPTKVEQSDLYQAVFGRPGDAQIPVLAPGTPVECFHYAIEAVRIATRYMTPVMILADGMLANASQPWKIPDIKKIKPFPVTFQDDPENFSPFARDPDTLARNWAIPGTAGLEHRIGGLEKDYHTGHISYDAANHQIMTDVRYDKVMNISKDIPGQTMAIGEEKNGLLVMSWGSSLARVNSAVKDIYERGHNIAHLHLRYLNPFPANLEQILRRYRRLVAVEMNKGQLATLIRDRYELPVMQINRVNGQPFLVGELEKDLQQLIEDHVC